MFAVDLSRPAILGHTGGLAARPPVGYMSTTEGEWPWIRRSDPNPLSIGSLYVDAPAYRSPVAAAIRTLALAISGVATRVGRIQATGEPSPRLTTRNAVTKDT